MIISKILQGSVFVFAYMENKLERNVNSVLVQVYCIFALIWFSSENLRSLNLLRLLDTHAAKIDPPLHVSVGSSAARRSIFHNFEGVKGPSIKKVTPKGGGGGGSGQGLLLDFSLI